MAAEFDRFAREYKELLDQSTSTFVQARAGRLLVESEAGAVTDPAAAYVGHAENP